MQEKYKKKGRKNIQGDGLMYEVHNCRKPLSRGKPRQQSIRQRSWRMFAIESRRLCRRQDKPEKGEPRLMQRFDLFKAT